MKSLDNKYQVVLDNIAGSIQSSTLLATFLDSEEEEDYKALADTFEPDIHALYEQVAENNPLQLLDLEIKLVDSRFEGLYMPKILGYAICRGKVSDKYKYRRPQDHLSKIMDAILASMNFEYITARIGQAVQVCFAISSDIWVTGLIDKVPSKSVKAYLKGKRLDKFRHLAERKVVYLNYSSQFRGSNFLSSNLPTELSDLFLYYDKLISFLEYRIQNDLDHSSYINDFVDILEHEEWGQYKEYVYLLMLVTNFIELNADQKKNIGLITTRLRKENPEFTEMYLNALLQGHKNEDLYFDYSTYGRCLSIFDGFKDDDIYKYFSVLSEISAKGLEHEDTVMMVREYYQSHEGLSLFNDCLRSSVLMHFRHLLNNLDETEFTSYFELNKTFVVYVNIFDNQAFNLDLKKAIVKYVKRLTKKYTDKRGRDYQEIKKFVTSSFLDMNFMTEKAIKELFTTRRVKKTKA